MLFTSSAWSPVALAQQWAAPHDLLTPQDIGRHHRFSSFGEDDAADAAGDDAGGDAKEGEQDEHAGIDENAARQVVNNFPALPFVIPIPVDGAGTGRSSGKARDNMPSPADLTRAAKWNGLYGVFHDVISMSKMDAQLKGGAANGAGGGTIVPRPSEIGDGVVGADFIYEAPINALGQPDMTAPSEVPMGGAVVDSGNAFL